jgi:hypothetical protein
MLGPGDDTSSAWDKVLAARDPGWLRAPDRPRTGGYLAEERLAGAEVSVEALVSTGTIVCANITEKTVLTGRYPVGVGHCVPAELPAPVQEELIVDTRLLIESTGFGYGCGFIHAEWILADSTPRLVECAARIPGDDITTLIDLAHGTRVVDDLFRLMTGGTVRPRRPRLAATPGIVTSVGGIEHARDMDGVV